MGHHSPDAASAPSTTSFMDGGARPQAPHSGAGIKAVRRDSSEVAPASPGAGGQAYQP